MTDKMCELLPVPDTFLPGMKGVTFERKSLPVKSL
jgi:hypothetical protein